ncbi:MAG: YicC/YloC family endoribonuclease [Terriglobales bacterium]|jgi:uncharacterized protein (TIGR00255 family)
MSIRSMTGFAQVNGQVNDQLAFTLSLKSVNHRFLDLHLRMPPESDGLEMKIRRMLKERLARGHVDVSLTLQSGEGQAVNINRPLVRSYVTAFRAMAAEAGIDAQPDLNAILRLAGAIDDGLVAGGLDEEFDAAVTAKLEEAVGKLNDMRAEEGGAIARELRQRLACLLAATGQIEGVRDAVTRAYMVKVRTRMEELVGSHAEPDRILQEAALVAERSDIQEEIARLQTHIQHFLGILDEGGEVGKKLDFLTQEMNRETNTLLSKTGGVAGEALRITETGLAMKAEIEKIREQVQNLE